MPIHAPSIRRPITCTCLAFLTALGGSITRAEEVSTPIVLARDGATEYVILLPEDPSPPQVFAATELQRFLLRMSGAFFPIRHHGDDRTAPAITLHDTGADSALGREGFFLRADGDGVHVGGSAGRGIVYGSFALLERLGCRWYAPDCEVIPNAPELRLARLDVTETPDFDYREPWYMMSWDEDWAVRNRINGMGPTLDAVRGGRFGYLSSYFCHTFDLILPADRFLETHPQWYSLVDGRRVGGQYKGQLCLTNEAMIEAFIDATRGVLDAHPETRILSVSQNDNQNYCQCDACSRIDDDEASQAGRTSIG